MFFAKVFEYLGTKLRMKTLNKVAMCNIRQHLLPFERSRFLQTSNCYNSVNIAARLTKMLPTH